MAALLAVGGLPEVEDAHTTEANPSPEVQPQCPPHQAAQQQISRLRKVSLLRL